MAGSYEAEWDKAKTVFEKESGKIIAVIEKDALASVKKKSGLRDEKTDAPRLKKPAASGWFGRKSSGMESACKGLDKASGAKVSAKDKRKAFDDYAKVAKKYEKELNDSVKDQSKPYRHVIPQIKAAGRRCGRSLRGLEPLISPMKMHCSVTSISGMTARFSAMSTTCWLRSKNWKRSRMRLPENEAGRLPFCRRNWTASSRKLIANRARK